MITVVYFDFGGVLTESGRSGFITQTIADMVGRRPEDIEIGDLHFLLRRGQGDASFFFKEIQKRYGVAISKEAFIEKVQSVCFPSKDVYALAERLRQQGIQTGLLSNVFAMNARELEKQGLYDGFNPIILSCDEGSAKPEQEIYDVAVDRAGVRPEEILFVDDQQKCLGPASAMGMHVVMAVQPSQIVADVTRIIREENGIDL